MQFDDLVALIETELAAMDPACRSRLVKKLQESTKGERAERASARAKAFAQQRGRCATCGETLKTTGPSLWMYQTQGEQIRCRTCITLERTRG